MPYAPIGERDHPRGEVTRFRDELAKSKGIAGIRLAIDAVTTMNTTVFRELPGILDTFRADMLIADQAETGGRYGSRSPESALGNDLQRIAYSSRKKRPAVFHELGF